ncbi:MULTISPECIES: autotransporter assembly complex family protein [unclassified Roseitalea]|uniref:autotransporter assembly complex protein TamA n=1 Tax=unclassified Roseitalea TaxID=2639107 RepID=UPI00273F3371|nr:MULTISPECIES: autotransporter assembly complex family protein [unclassified Roseitalea]
MLAGPALIWTAPPAGALELFGLCLFGPCRQEVAEPDLIDPKPYQVSFNVEGGGDELRDALQSASALWQGRNEPAAGSAGLLARAKGDYRRLLAALYNQARYGGLISITANGAEVADLPAGHDFADGTVITVTVDPVAPFAFGTLRIDNQAPPTDDRTDQVPDPADIGFLPGAPARAGIVREAGDLSVQAWRQQGYAKARVADQQVVANHRERRLRVAMGLDPGPYAVYGNVSVEGTERMNPAFVARQTGLRPGEEYDPDDIERARERLQRLGVFNTAAVKEGEEVGADNGLPINVIVDERKLRRIGIGASYSTVDGLGAEAFWLHRNLFGRAERLRIEGSVSGIDSGTDPGAYDYRFGATLGLPGRFTPDTDVTLEAIAEREVLDSYTRTGGRTAVSLTHFASTSLTYSASLFADYAEFTDMNGTRRLGVLGVSGGAELDTRDDELDPTSGVFLSGTVTPFYEWELGNGALQLDAEARGYRAFDADDRTVIAGRIRAGALFGPAPALLPPDRLYFAGGGASVRGFAHRSIGAGGMSAMGGKSLLEGSVEVRRSVTERIGAVGFVDAALVSAGSTPDFSQTPRVGAGVGLRYDTGFGPIRVDLAFPVNRRPGDNVLAIYAGIGQAF